MKLFFEILVVLLVLFAAWYAVPTHYVVTPLSLRYEGKQFLFIRDTHFGSVWGKYSREVRSELGQCHKTGRAYYEERGLSPARVIAPEVQECIPAQGEVFVMEMQRMALIWNWFPLRPSSYRWSCVVGGTDCVLVSK